MSHPKASKSIILVLILALFLGFGAYYYMPVLTNNYEQDAPVISLEPSSGDAKEEPQASQKTLSTKKNKTETASSEQVSVNPLPLKDYTLGDQNAPVTIYEFSSLSCGHCGSFHESTYPQLKKDYIETGKAKLIMIDFPLNLPALEGAMLAHCLPESQYFNFLQLLFTSQDNWLSGNYQEKLIQNASLAGLNQEQAEACLANKDLREAILTRMENASEKWEISSTPSFILNQGDEKITGNLNFQDFSARVEALFEQSENETTSE